MYYTGLFLARSKLRSPDVPTFVSLVCPRATPRVIVDRYLWLWLVGSSALAYAWPILWQASLGEPPGFDPFLLAGRYLDAWIVATMFSIGSMLPRDEVQEVIRRWPTVFAGVAVQYTAMPLLAYVFGTLLVADSDLFVGVVMVGCVPGAMASNVLTLNARGNASYSVSLTTVATLLSPLAVPLAIFLTLRAWAGEQAAQLLRSSFYMTAVVVIPVLLGFATRRKLVPERMQWEPVARTVANISILVIIAVVVARNRDQFTRFEPALLMALASINVCGFLAGNLAARCGRFDAAMRRALTIEVGMQNAGLGVGLAQFLFPQQAAIAVAPALYTFGCMLSGTLLAHYWSQREP